MVPSITARAYDRTDYLEETILNPANCTSSTVKNSIQDNKKFAHSEPVKVQTDVIKSNFFGDSYV